MIGRSLIKNTILAVGGFTLTAATAILFKVATIENKSSGKDSKKEEAKTKNNDEKETENKSEQKEDVVIDDSDIDIK